MSQVRATFALIAGLSLAAVGAALVSQHVFDMQPCPWCVAQRVVFVAIALVAVAGLLWTSRLGRLLTAAGVSLLATAGIAAALWQHFVAASSTSCNQTLADKIISGIRLDELAPEVFAARASCAEAAVKLLGVSYEFWSLGLFVAIGIVALTTMSRSARNRARPHR